LAQSVLRILDLSLNNFLTSAGRGLQPQSLLCFGNWA